MRDLKYVLCFTFRSSPIRFTERRRSHFTSDRASHVHLLLTPARFATLPRPRSVVRVTGTHLRHHTRSATRIVDLFTLDLELRIAMASAGAMQGSDSVIPVARGSSADEVILFFCEALKVSLGLG